MSPNDSLPFDRRDFLAATGAAVGLGTLAGCLGDGDEDDSDGNGDGNENGNGNGDGNGNATDGGDGDAGGNGGEDIVVAGLQPYSGPFALYGDAHTAGIEFAFSEINADGGVLDRNIVHDPVDTESDPSEAVSVLTRAIEEDDAVAAVGPVSSDVGVSASETAEQQEVPLYLHAAGSMAILDRDSRYTFRTALPPAPAFIQAVSNIIGERGYETVGAITADYAWGISAEQAIDVHFPDDISLTMDRAPFGEDDFAPYLREMPEDLDILVGSGHPPGLNDMFAQMLELGFEPELFTAAVSPPEAGYSALGDDVARGFTFGHLPDVYADEYQDVAQAFYDETGGYFGPTQAAGYMTGHLIAEGLRQAGEVDPAALSDVMREIEFDTIYAQPVQYTEWGELDQYELVWSGFELEAPDYYPDGDFDLSEEYRTDTLDAVDPADYE